jgi:plasmid stabilization system protein ParE
MKLVWRAAALGDLRRLQDFFAPKNPRAAGHAISTIRGSVKIHETFPNIGRAVTELDATFRDWTVNFGAGLYIIRYRVKQNQIIVIAIRHRLEAKF